MRTMECAERLAVTEACSEVADLSVRNLTKSFQVNTTLKLVMAIEMRDGDTAAHMVRVGQLSGLLAWKLTGDKLFSSLLCLAAPMHDIGKLGVPDSILKKPGPLDEAEWAVMRRHPEWGARLLHLADDPLFTIAEHVALCHHERYDGLGYPHGRAATDIPLEARIASVADCFDALSMKRCYREAWTRDKVVQTLQEAAGTLFDPTVVRVTLSNLPEIYQLIAEVNRRCEGMDAARFHASVFEPLFFGSAI